MPSHRNAYPKIVASLALAAGAPILLSAPAALHAQPSAVPAGFHLDVRRQDPEGLARRSERSGRSATAPSPAVPTSRSRRTPS